MSKKGSQKEVLFKNAEVVSKQKNVQEWINKLRCKWKIPSKGFREDNEYRIWFNKLISDPLYDSRYGPSQYSLFLEDIYKLCEDVKFPAYWNTFFFYLTTKNEIKNSLKVRSGRTIDTPRIRLSQDKKTIMLLITANTKQKDVEFIWNDVKNFQKQMPDFDKRRQRRKMQRDLLMYKKLQIGKKPTEAYHELIDILPDDESEPEATTKGLQRIKKIIKGQ
ncbi:hypothetical protein M1349_01120 [Patescibacteria group bacterium]|nr:hypothetical protein [Patescibacteria group bacterium]